MMTLRCTRKLLDLLGCPVIEDPPASTTALGDWYANVIPTAAGDLIMFVNERSLLSVALPAEAVDTLIPAFVARVYNLLRHLRVSTEVARRECDALLPVTYAKTASRSVLGSMNDIALGYQAKAVSALEAGRTPRISEAELAMSRRFHSPLDHRLPVDVARSMLTEHHGSV